MSNGTAKIARSGNIPISADEEILAKLGYKQEFKRAFKPFEVFGVAFSIFGLFPSITSILFYSIPNGGALSMVWGWLVASFFILCIGFSMAELASAAPTSGGLYYWTHSLASRRYKNILAWIVGYSNTIGNIAAVASTDWAAAVQIMAAATIGSQNQSWVPTTGQTYALFLGIIVSHAMLCSLGTIVLARLQWIYVALNVGLCLAVIIAVPIVTPKEFHNDAGYALGNFSNLNGYRDGFAFILSFMSPVYTILAFDSCVHISEEATNAVIVVPWAIVISIIASVFLGTAVLIVLSFYMGKDLESIVGNPIGQPMATILFNSLNKKGALVLWAFVVVAQYMMGSSMLSDPVWFTATCAALLTLLAFAGPAAISAIFSVTVVGLYLAFAVPIFSRFAFSSTNNFKPGPFTIGKFGLPVALVALAFMSVMFVVLMFPSTPHTNAQNMNYTVAVMCGVLILSLVWYFWPKYGGIHWFNGPVPNIHMVLEDPSELRGNGEGEKVVH